MQEYNVERFDPPTWRKLVIAVDDLAGGNVQELSKKNASDQKNSLEFWLI